MKATIYTYTVMRFAPTGFEEKVPYCVAVVDTGEAKICTRLRGFNDGDSIEVGQEVKPIESPSDPSELFELTTRSSNE